MKIALFGGTFDPIHKGHMEIIKALFNELHMDKVIIIPTNITYYKKNNAMLSYNMRLEVCKMALNEASSLNGMNIEVSDIERNIGPNEGFSKTVISLKEKYLNDELYTVIGSDSYNYLKTWIKYEGIIDNSRLIVVTRPGALINKEYDIPYIELKLNMDISSTRIRKEITSLILEKLK